MKTSLCGWTLYFTSNFRSLIEGGNFVIILEILELELQFVVLGKHTLWLLSPKMLMLDNKLCGIPPFFQLYVKFCG